jgi:hypothetical protein
MFYEVEITTVRQSVGYSSVSGEEMIGESFETKTLCYNNKEAAQAAVDHISEFYPESRAQIIEREQTTGAAWSEFKPSVYDYYQQKEKMNRNRRFSRQSRSYGRRKY